MTEDEDDHDGSQEAGEENTEQFEDQVSHGLTPAGGEATELIIPIELFDLRV